MKTLIINGCLVILGGFIAGFHLGGVAVAGDAMQVQAWTLAHMEGLLNGMFLWLIAGFWSYLVLSAVQQKALIISAVGMAYCNLIFGWMRGLTGARGLEFIGGPDNLLAAAAGMLGVPLGIVMLLLIAIGAWRAKF